MNDEQFFKRAEIIWEKGTNRAAFSRGEIRKYDWIDVGSSFLPSEINAAFLYAQLENMERIQENRIARWKYYYNAIKSLGMQLPVVPEYSSNNAHIFYLLCKNRDERTQLMAHFAQHGINAIFHYLPLHQSPYFSATHKLVNLPNALKISETILRLPLFFELTISQQDYIIEKLRCFLMSEKDRQRMPAVSVK